MERIGERIREARKQRGFTQKELGNKTDIAESTIRKYELGIRKPKFETIFLIASALEYDVDFFYNFYDKMGKDSFTVREKCNDFEKEIETLESMVSDLKGKNERYLRKIEQLRITHKKEMEDLQSENQQLKAAIRSFTETVALIIG